jgi:ATP-dependent helicase/nuclease subunit B
MLGDLAALEERLASEVRACKAGDPLAPVTILIGNTLLRPYLRRRLARGAGGHLNLHLLTPNDLARSLGEQALAGRGRVRLPYFGDRILARRVAESTPTSYFAPVSRSPGFAETLRTLFRELGQAAIDPGDWQVATDADPGPAGKHRDIGTLYEQHQARLGRFHTAEEWYRFADPARFDARCLLVYGVWRPTTNQRQLLERLGREARLVFFLPWTGTDADDAHQEMRQWLDGLGAVSEYLDARLDAGTSLGHLQRRLFHPPEPASRIDSTVGLLSAPDPPREVREAVRTCLRWAREDGIPFHEMAVAYRSAESYRALVDQVFQQVGIVTYLHEKRRLSEEPAGQRLIALLNLVGSALPRAGVMEFLTETVLPRATQDRFGDAERPIQPATWDHISREASIVEGKDQWRSRLRSLIESKGTLEEIEDEIRATQLKEEIDEIARFERFITAFAAALDEAPDLAAWNEHLDFVCRLARNYIDGIGPILERLEMLRPLQELDPDRGVPFEQVRETVRVWLDRQDSAAVNGWLNGSGQEIPSGQFGRRGVTVLDVNSLRHLRFKAVVILGVAERSFPSPPRQDPLLLDRERKTLNDRHGWALPLRAMGPDDEALQFALALQAAEERVQISFPRGEAGSSRSHLPSHFFRAAAAALTGTPVEASQVDRLPRNLYTRVAAGTFKLPDGATALDEHEYDRDRLERRPELGLLVCGDDRPTLRHARMADSARRDPELSCYDGLLDDASVREISWSAGVGQAVSPSRLETYATCPFKYFLQYVLRLKAVEEPELLERISPLERGSLVHKVLEDFLAECGSDDPPAEHRREAHLERLRRVARRHCERLESQGLVGYRVLWEYDRMAIFEDLEEWYEHEVEDQRRHGLQPLTFELRFGRAWSGEVSGTYSRDTPFMFQFRGGSLSFQGRADRVDVSTDRSRFRVIDYKSGRVGKWHQKETLSGGRALQLPIYLLAAADLLGIDWRESRAEYFYVSRKGEFKRVALDGSWLEENWEGFTTLLGGLAASMESGLFMPVPRIQKFNNCEFCDYEPLCPGKVAGIARRKRADDRAAAFLRLIEAEA